MHQYIKFIYFGMTLCIDVLLTVHLNIFILVFNQLDAHDLFHNKFYFMPLHVSSTCAHHQEVKIALHSLWYHHTYRCIRNRYCYLLAGGYPLASRLQYLFDKRLLLYVQS